MRRGNRIGVAALGAAGLLAAAGPGAATADEPPVTSTTLAAGTTSAPWHLNTHGERQVLTRKGVIQPGASTGWHAHTGPMITTVAAGTLTWVDQHCVRHDTRAGQSVLIPDGPPAAQNGFNLGTEPVVLYVVDVLPPGAEPTVPAADPGCVPRR